MSHETAYFARTLPRKAQVMSLPKRNERQYLEIKDAGGGFLVWVKHEYAGELSVLLRQHGITHKRRKGAASGADELFFSAETDKPKLIAILESYKNAMGS
jgi:hypothetical protein